MLDKNYIAYIAVGILFIVGVLMLTLVKPFGEYWIVGLGILSASIVGIVLITYCKIR